jgi:hypothetical protein
MCAGRIWYTVNVPIYGLRQRNAVAIEKGSCRFSLILDGQKVVF